MKQTTELELAAPRKRPPKIMPDGLPYSNRRTHGMTRTPEYSTWARMIRRCENKKEINYERYGGRGITVCAEWRTSFAAFLRDMGKRPSPSHSIERINNDEGYRKENCRWATRAEQCVNKRNNILVTFNGQTKILAHWCRELGLHYNITRQRLQREGWSTDRALSTPTRAPWKETTKL